MKWRKITAITQNNGHYVVQGLRTVQTALSELSLITNTILATAHFELITCHSLAQAFLSVLFCRPYYFYCCITRVHLLFV